VLAGALNAISRHEHHVQLILDQEKLVLLPVDSMLHQAGYFVCGSATQKGVSYEGCLGELKCSCPFGGVCKHLQAAAQRMPFTHNMRAVAADMLLKHAMLEEVDLASGILRSRYGSWLLLYCSLRGVAHALSGGNPCIHHFQWLLSIFWGGLPANLCKIYILALSRPQATECPNLSDSSA
jgi:hypothetical protein